MRTEILKAFRNEAHRQGRVDMADVVLELVSQETIREVDASPPIRVPADIAETVSAFRALESEDCVSVLSDLDRGKGGSDGLLPFEPSRQIASLLGTPRSLRASFAYSLAPALLCGIRARKRGQSCMIRFIDPSETVGDRARRIARIVGIEIDAVIGQPLARSDAGEFEAELSMPPFGTRVEDCQVVSRRTLDRVIGGPGGRVGVETAAIADLLEHAPSANAVMCCTEGSLSRSVGVEPLVRQDLLQSGRLRAVFSAPQGVMLRFTGIAIGLLVLAPEGDRSALTRMIDLGDESFSTWSGRGARDIRADASWSEALSVELTTDSIWGSDIDDNEIAARNAVLSVSRYLQSKEQRALSAFLEEQGSRRLDEVAEVIRPRSLPKDEKAGFTVREAAPAGITEAGFVEEPRKRLRVSPATLRLARKQGLVPGDLVFSTKGTIGAVGIVTEAAPDLAGDAFWTAGQSLVILRPKSVAPEVLYEYLSDPVVRSHVESFAGGAGVRILSAKDLSAISVPVPSAEEQERIVAAFRGRARMYNEIASIRQGIDHDRAASWPAAAIARRS